MADWSAFPLATPAAPENDPWGAFPLAQEPPVPSGSSASPASPSGSRGTVADPHFADLPVPGTFTPQEPVEHSLIDQIMGGAGYALQSAGVTADGLTRGASNIAGLPVDAINAAPMLANVIPGVEGVGPISDSPVGGSQSIYDALRLWGALGDAPQPQDAFQRVLGRAGEEIGATAVPGLGLIRMGAAMGAQGARQLPGLARMFVEPAAVNPSAFLAKETGIAAGAGIGAGIANEVFDNQDRENPWIDVGGALGGATVTGAGGALARSTSDVFRALFGNGSYADEVVTDAVMRRVAEAAGVTAPPGEEPDLTSLITQIEQGPRVGNVVPGFTESIADRTANPGLAALEYSRQGGPNAGAYTQTRASNTAAIDAAMGEVEPQGTPGQFSSQLEAERVEQLARAAAQTTGAQDTYARAVEGLQPLMTGEGRGANIRAALEDASVAARNVLSEAWRPLEDATDTPMDVGPLAQAFETADASVPRALEGNIPAASGVPETFIEPGTGPQPTGLLDASGNPIMRAAQPPVTTASLSEIMGIRTALTNELRRQGITPQEVRLIEDRIGRLDTYLDQNMPPDLREQYDAARAATVDFNNRFTRPQTAIGQVLDTREGLPRYQDSDVAQRFVQSDQGRIADFEALMREAGTDLRVQTAVRDQILNDVRSRGLLENPQALNDYLAQYGTVFERFPQLREELGNAGALRTQFDEMQRSEQELRQMLTQQGRSTIANYLSYSDENATRAMNGVLNSRDPAAAIDELLTFVGDETSAVEGARRVFWDILQGKSRAGGRTTMNIDGSQPWSPYALNQFLDNPVNAAVAERLWRDNPDHLARIREIAEALQGVDLRNAAKAPNTSGTPQGSFNQLLSPETLQSRFYAYQSGRISGSFLITAVVSTLVRRGVRKAQEEGFQRMLDDVVQNADTAALLMKANNPANRAALARKAKLWFGNEASTIVNAMSAEDETEDNQAIMRMEALN